METQQSDFKVVGFQIVYGLRQVDGVRFCQCFVSLS